MVLMFRLEVKRFMILIVYIIQLVFGVWVGYHSGKGSDSDHVFIAVVFFIAAGISTAGLLLAPFYHVMSTFAIWLIAGIATSETVAYIEERKDEDEFY